MTAWEIFTACQTQKIMAVGMSATLLGLRHEAIALQMELRGVRPEDRLDLFDAVRLLEAYYVAHWNQRAAGKAGGSKGRSEG